MNRLAERIDHVIALDPGAPAVEFENNWTTWGNIADARRKVAQELDRAGLGAASRIGVMMRNHVAVIPAIHEVVGTRCLVVLNPMLNPDKLAHDVVETRVAAVIGVARDLDIPLVRVALEKTGCLVIEMTGDKISPVKVRQPRTEVNKADAMAVAAGIAVEMLTSGTTGAPKRIPIRSVALEAAVFGAARFEKGRSESDEPRLRSGVQLLMAPLSHTSGLLALLNATVAGRSVALLERFRVDEFSGAVSRHGIKVASIPPAALKMVFDARVPKSHLQSLKAFRVGTAPLDPDLADAIFETYDIPVLQNYGATEFGGVAGWTLDDFKAYRQSRRGSVGRLNPGIEGRIVDPASGDLLPYRETGVLELRSQQIGDGVNWTRTTDLGQLDGENFLWIMGRVDNAIIRGGFKIQPDEVVRALESHPAIVEAAVVGLPDDRLGQIPAAAYIVSKDIAPPAEDGLIAFLKERLTGYQIPVCFRAVEELPRTNSMKADLQAVKALF